MKFSDKYTNLTEQTLPENKDKIVLNDDAFAIGEMIEQLMKQVRRLK